MFAAEAAGTGAELADRFGIRAKEVLDADVEELRAQGYGGTYVSLYCEGYVKGYAEVLIELITTKFGTLPPATVHTIRTGQLTQLCIWTTRVLTATTLDEIFA